MQPPATSVPPGRAPPIPVDAMNTRDTPAVAAEPDVLAFGPFQLDLEQRVLREGLTAIRLNKRALEILIALAERAGEVVTKHELLQRGWPGGGVQEGVLRVHIAALRKVLGDDRSGIRYVENVFGRGYRFVAQARAEKKGAETSGAGAPWRPFARPAHSSPWALGRCQHAGR
jgi:DNA-binding winged helix-turn-helix (wHTH) protein